MVIKEILSRNLTFQMFVLFDQCKSLKHYEKCFLFRLKSSFLSRDIEGFSLDFWSYGQKDLIRSIR